MPSRSRFLAGILVLLAASAAGQPVAAQFASVPRAPAPTPYDVRFGPDTALTPVQEAAARAEARRDLRAWVDSAARGMGIQFDLPDSIPVPRDSAALDSLTRQVGPAGARRDSIRRDSIRRDSIRRDSLMRRTPPDQPMQAVRSGGSSSSRASLPVPADSHPETPGRQAVAPLKDATNRPR